MLRQAPMDSEYSSDGKSCVKMFFSLFASLFFPTLRHLSLQLLLQLYSSQHLLSQTCFSFPLAYLMGEDSGLCGLSQDICWVDETSSLPSWLWNSIPSCCFLPCQTDRNTLALVYIHLPYKWVRSELVSSYTGFLFNHSLVCSWILPSSGICSVILASAFLFLLIAF